MLKVAIFTANDPRCRKPGLSCLFVSYAFFSSFWLQHHLLGNSGAYVMTAEVIQLNETNVRDPVATLRAIADQIEAGASWVRRRCRAWRRYDGGLRPGEDSEAPSVAMLLHSASCGYRTALSSTVANLAGCGW
jgi:hypothetical protein